MQSVQRHIGKYMKRTADNQQVHVLLKDFEDADQLLSRIIDASKAWRESWLSILAYQHRLFAEYEVLYAPIVGANEDYHGHSSIDTPDSTMARTAKITAEYEGLKNDLSQEISQVDARMIHPAQHAKDSLQLLKKTIKKREDRKLDFERYQSKVDSGLKKPKSKMTDRDSAALAKAQMDLTAATEAYAAADDNLRNCLPRLLTSVFSLLPHILAAQIQIQNDLLAHYYTMLHNYCEEEGFPSPSPPMDEVIRIWEDAFKPAQHAIEIIPMIATGKAVRTSMRLENGHMNGNSRRPSHNSLSSRVPSVSPARVLPPSPNYDHKPKITSSPSPSTTSLLSPPIPTPTESASVRSPSPSYGMSFAPAGPNMDYFSRDRQVSSGSLSSAIAQKKKPPPPPPRTASQQHFTFVTALYDFDGQGEGDLLFKEGDKIKVLKKTNSTDDWWTGELRGVKGAFPANYCQ